MADEFGEVFDFSETRDFEPLPVGSYSVHIDSLEDGVSLSGNPKWIAHYTCTFPGYEGRSGRFDISLAPKGLSTLYQLLKALGLSSEELKDKANPITKAQAKGLIEGAEVCIVLQEVESYKEKGKFYINVKYVETPDKAKGPATASPSAAPTNKGDELPKLFS